MANEIVSQAQVELLLPSDIRSLREDLATMNKLANDIDVVRSEAIALTITDKPKRIRAGELNAQWKDLCKQAENTIAKHKKAINDFKKEYITTPENKVLNAGEELKGILSRKMADWDQAEERAAQAERDREAARKKAELEREAEEKRLADEAAAVELRKKRVAEIKADLKAGRITKRESAKLLKEAGADEEAAKAKAWADEEDGKKTAAKVADSVEVHADVPVMAGNVRRVNYSAECTDVDGFLSEYVRCCIMAPERAAKMRAMIEVSNQLLSAEARTRIKTSDKDDNSRHDLTKEQFEKIYPFVKVNEDRTY